MVKARNCIFQLNVRFLSSDFYPEKSHQRVHAAAVLQLLIISHGCLTFHCISAKSE